jgi:outer membrane protein TolC
MQRCTVIFLTLIVSASAETHVLTLREVVDIATRQNPDVVYARLDEQRAALDVRVARDPFSTKLSVGSGLAYTNGFPLSIEGSAPSLIQARSSQSIFNRPQSFLVAQAKENARGAVLDTQVKRNDVALRAANLFLDLQRSSRLRDLVKRQFDSLQQVLDMVRARISEGRELPIEEKRARVNLARASQRVTVVEGDYSYTSSALASLLGFPADDRITPSDAATPEPAIPSTSEAMVEEALGNSKELKRLQSSMLAKGYELRSYRSSRLPRIDLIGQYALLGKFNNYDVFYRGFQRNNGEIGVSFQLPILPGSAPRAQAKQAELDEIRLRTQMEQTRSRVALEARRAYQDYKDAEAARDVAQLDLELARDQLTILLARLQEGRASASEIEQSRFLENERWISLYDAIHNVEAARLNILKQRGDLLAALQ